MTADQTLGPVDLQIHGRAIDLQWRKAQTVPDQHQLAVAGDHRITVIDGSPRLAAQQIGVGIDGAIGPRPFTHKLAALLLFTQRKVAGGGVEDHIDATLEQAAARTRSDPGVFADLKTNAHPADLKDQIANRNRLTGQGD